MDDWKEYCKVLYIGKCKPFAVVRDDTIIEADSVEELLDYKLLSDDVII